MANEKTIGYGKDASRQLYCIVAQNVSQLSNEARLSGLSLSAAVHTAKEEAKAKGAAYIGNIDRVSLGLGAFDEDTE